MKIAIDRGSLYLDNRAPRAMLTGGVAKRFAAVHCDRWTTTSLEMSKQILNGSQTSGALE
jgi:hypothetical protein